MKNQVNKYLIFNLFLTASCLMCFVSFTLAQTPEGDDAWRLAQSAPAVHSLSNPVNSADLAKKGFKGSPERQFGIAPIRNQTAVVNTLSGYIGHVNGVYLSGVTVRLTGNVSRTTVTDANGYYTFNDVPNASFTLTPSKTGYQFNPSAVNFTSLTQSRMQHFSASGPAPPAPAPAPGTPTLSWINTYNSENNAYDSNGMLARDSSGNIYYGGISGLNSAQDIVLVKTDPNGVRQWARRFDSGLQLLDQLVDIGVDSQGNVYLAGTSYRGFQFDFDYVLLKYNPQGDLIWTRYYNAAESTPNVGASPDVAASLKIDAGNNIYLTGRSFGVERSFGYTTLKYDSNGNLLWQARFVGGLGDTVSEVEVDSAGNVYVTGTSSIDRGGETSNVVTIKYSSSGQEVWRNRFDTQTSYGQERAEELELDCQGNVYVAGNVKIEAGPDENLVLKINSAGVTQWVKRWSVSNHAANEIVSAFKADCSGNVVVTGITNINNEINNNDAYTLKLNPANGQTLWSQIYDEVFSEDYQGDNKLMLDAAGNVYVGTTSQIFSNYNLVIHKYSPTGQILWKFQYDNPNNGYDGFIDWRRDLSAPTMLIDAQGNVYFAGESAITGQSFNLIAGKISQAQAVRTRFDYDGDGKADISVFRPSAGSWYISNSSNNSFTGVQFGIASDKIAPADFDGDGKTDISVFRDGFWYRLNSSNNQFVAVQFGSAGDIPVPGDFDGDGRADISVFRPSNGTWYRLDSSTNQFVAQQFGTSGDLPQLADFDGDGKSDLTVFRPSTGGWYASLSSNNAFLNVTFGTNGDVPTPADYDGDGKTDVSVFRPAAGTWYRMNSSNNAFFGQQFGASGDVPVPADYDGDGKADIGVFRGGNWYWVNSSNNQFRAVQFGTTNDRPTPAAFLP